MQRSIITTSARRSWPHLTCWPGSIAPAIPGHLPDRRRSPCQWTSGPGSAQPTAQRRPQGDLDPAAGSGTMEREEGRPGCCTGPVCRSAPPDRWSRIGRDSAGAPGRAPQSAEPGAGSAGPGTAQRNRLIQYGSTRPQSGQDRTVTSCAIRAIGLFVPKPSRDGASQRCDMPDLGTTVRQRPLMSTAGDGDCYSLGYSVAFRSRWVPMPGDSTIAHVIRIVHSFVTSGAL